MLQDSKGRRPFSVGGKDAGVGLDRVADGPKAHLPWPRFWAVCSGLVVLREQLIAD